MGWTEQQIQTLKKMWGNGHSASDIAKYLGGGITRNAVIGKAHRLKLSAGVAAARTMPEPPSKVNGVVMASIKKISGNKKTAAAAPRTMMRTMPTSTVVSEPALRPSLREPLPRPIDMIKRSEGIPVTKAGERHCRWPIGDPRSPDFRFCGCETVEGLPYCTEHARVAYQTVSRKARANANAEHSVPELRVPKKD